MKKLRSALLCLLAVILLAGTCPAAYADNPVQEACGSMVRIATMLCIDGEPLYVDGFPIVQTGTGICLGKEDGEVRAVATNRHVVDDGELKSLLPAQVLDLFGSSISSRVCVLADGKLYEARSVYVSMKADLALIRLSAPVKNRHPAVFSENDAFAVTDTVYALGYPGLADVTDLKTDPYQSNDAYLAALVPSGLEDISVTRGAISRVHVTSGGVDYVQHDADISHGNSGGALVTERGQVVGVNTVMFIDADAASKVQLSIDVKELRSFLDQQHADYIVGSAGSGGLKIPTPVIVGAVVIVLVLLFSGGKRRTPATAAAPAAGTPASGATSAAASASASASAAASEPSKPTHTASAPDFSRPADIPPTRPDRSASYTPPAHTSAPPKPQVSIHMGKAPSGPSTPTKKPGADAFETPSAFTDRPSVPAAPAPEPAAPASTGSGPHYTVSTSFAKKETKTGAWEEHVDL